MQTIVKITSHQIVGLLRLFSEVLCVERLGRHALTLVIGIFVDQLRLSLGDRSKKNGYTRGIEVHAGKANVILVSHLIVCVIDEGIQCTTRSGSFTPSLDVVDREG